MPNGMIDCHVHTRRCRHATGTADDYLRRAEQIGLSVLTFTDHLPLPAGFDDGYAMPEQELSDYIAEVVEVSRRGGQTEVLLGIEADWLPAHTAHTERLISLHPFDVVMGSVHFLDDWAFDDPALVHRYANWSSDALWTRYFDEIEHAASSGLFDVMAHPDLVKKFGILNFDPPTGWSDAVAESLASAKVAIEVSTAGLRKPCGEIYPGHDLLAACRRAGVAATIGSDAHAPAEVAYRYEDACDALAAAGYSEVVVFRGRSPRREAL